MSRAACGNRTWDISSFDRQGDDAAGRIRRLNLKVQVSRGRIKWHTEVDLVDPYESRRQAGEQNRCVLVINDYLQRIDRKRQRVSGCGKAISNIDRYRPEPRGIQDEYVPCEGWIVRPDECAVPAVHR